MSLEELKLIDPKNITEIAGVLITFDTDKPELLDTLGWIIKRWEVIDRDDIWQEADWKKIIWTKDKDLWLKLKREFWIKRFKVVDRLHTDIDVKRKWIEIIRFHQNFAVVRWYQNIKFYEKIDFGKPSRSMKMGMMPAKLTHIMINIGINTLSESEKKDWTMIYDPFAWSGTTGFIANYLWYGFIWSDIDTFHLENNQVRREEQEEKNWKTFDTFKHDITQVIPDNTLQWNILIVSEWRLWPMVTDKTRKWEISGFQTQVRELYKEFIYTISETRKLHRTKAVFTIPYYIRYNNILEEEIKNLAENLNRKFSSIDEVYSREKQKVWRKIIILE